MCASTRFIEAMLLRNIKARTIVKTKFFTLVGFSSFRSRAKFHVRPISGNMCKLGMEQFASSAYHPEFLE